MPPVRGLYAAALPPLFAAFFASSPYLQTGPVALTALLSFGVLSSVSTPGSDEYIALGLLLAMVVGVVRIGLGLVRAGPLAYLMSQPMLLGFIPGATLLIIATQLPGALGVSESVPGNGILEDAAWALTHPGSWEAASIVLSVLIIALVLASPRLHRMFPAVLIAVIVGVLYSSIADYGGTRVGEIPAGLPPIGFDVPWSELSSLLLGGVVIALVGFAEPASIARTFAARERQRWDANREFVSQGVANVAAGLSGGFPVGGSFSRSALNKMAGAKTRWSGAVTGLAVLIFLPFASVVEPLPRAVLSAIVIGAVLPLVRLLPLARLWHYSKPQFLVGWVTFGLTLGLAPNIQWAVLAGIGLSLGIHLVRELTLDIHARADATTLHIRPSGVLWFGSAYVLEDRFVELLALHPEATRLKVYLGGVGRVDLSGALALRRIVQDARSTGLEVDLVDVPPRARRWVRTLIEAVADPIERASK